MPSLGKDKIEQLIRAYFSDLLSKADELSYLLPDDDKVDLGAESEAMEAEAVGIRGQIASRSYDTVTKAHAEELLAPFGVGRREEDFDAVCNGVLRAKLEQRRILTAMLRGDYQNTVPIDPLFEGVTSPGMPSLPGEEGSSAALSISKVVEKYSDLKSKFDWSPKTRIEIERVLNWFVEFVGKDRKTATVTVDDVREFRDALLRLPHGFAKSKTFKGMSFREAAAAGTDGKTLSAGTLVKYLSGIKGFFAWCEDEGYTRNNPAQKIKMPVKGSPDKARYPFSMEQLKLIFHSPIYIGCKSPARRTTPGTVVIRDGKYWVPLVALLSGMRMSEVIQMRVADIKEYEGVPFFNVCDDAPDQNLKNKTARRVIPIHADLIRMGFLDFVRGVREKHPNRRLFDEIKPGKNGSYAHNFSKFFARYLGEIGAKTDKTAFHSFRHNFKDALRAAEIQDTRQDALMGHANPSMGETYGSEYMAPLLNTNMVKVASPIDLSHLFVTGD